MDPAHVLVSAPWFFSMSDHYPSPAPSDVFSLRRRQPDAYTPPSYAPYENPRHRSRPRSTSELDAPRGVSPARSTLSSGSRAPSHYGGPPSSVSPVTSSIVQRPLAPRPPPPKHTKHRLRDVDRKNICLYHIEHPHARQEDIGAAFNVERSTISKILKEKARWLNISPEDESNEQTSRHRSSKFPEIEWDLQKSLQSWSDQGINITDNLIRTRALEIARDLRISTERFKGSSGWVENFKIRQDIRRGEWHKSNRVDPMPRENAPRLAPPQGRNQGQSQSHAHGMDLDMNYGHAQAQSLHQHHPQHHQQSHPHQQQQQQQQWGGSPDSHDSSDSSPIPGPSSSHPLVLDPALQSQPHISSHIQSQSQGHSHPDSSPDMGPATVQAPSAAGTHTPVQTQLALDPAAIQHSPEGYDAHAHPHHAEYMHHHHPHLLDHPHAHIDMRPQAYVDGEKMIPLGVIGDRPPPTLQEAEDAMNTVIAWVDRCAPEGLLLESERNALGNVKCALFSHANGIPYSR